MEQIPENGDTPLTHGEFLKCWVWLDRRVRTLEITNKINLAIGISILVAVLVKYI